MILLETVEDLKKIQYGDYLIGVESYGEGYRVCKGLIHSDYVRDGSNYVEIKADDEWGGARGTMLDISVASISIVETSDNEYNKKFIEKNIK